jgi:hypothetical protein
LRLRAVPMPRNAIRRGRRPRQEEEETLIRDAPPNSEHDPQDTCRAQRWLGGGTASGGPARQWVRSVGKYLAAFAVLASRALVTPSVVWAVIYIGLRGGGLQGETIDNKMFF